ncbi:MAG: hypothetical protein ACI936_002259 [Paraglaciecola sp.]|jgi:hypothetical protein
MQTDADMARLRHVSRSFGGLNGDLFKLAPKVTLGKQAVREPVGLFCSNLKSCLLDHYCLDILYLEPR